MIKDIDGIIFCMFCTTLLYPFLALDFSPLHLLAPSAVMLDQTQICDIHAKNFFFFNRSVHKLKTLYVCKRFVAKTLYLLCGPFMEGCLDI